MGTVEAVELEIARVNAAIEALEPKIEKAEAKVEAAENAGSPEATVQQLRKKEEQLRENKNKLLDKEKQLREEKARLQSAVSTTGGNKGSNMEVCARLLGEVNHWEAEGALEATAADFGEKLLAPFNPLPASVQIYDQINDEDENLGRKLKLEGDCSLVRRVSGLLDDPEPTAELKELATSFNVMKFLSLLQRLAKYAPDRLRIHIRLSWNQAERRVSRPVTQPGTIVRPDTHLVTEKLSLLFGEDKEANDELTEAWKDHRRKLNGGLNPVAYGRVPFIPLYAAAGDLIQFGRLTSDGQVQRAGRAYDWTVQGDRIAIVIAVVNIYKLLVTLVKLAPEDHQRFPVFDIISRPNGAEILICLATVHKKIENSADFFQSIHNDYETVKTAYELANGKSFAVWHESISNTPGKKRGSTDQPRCIYKVVLTRLGFCIEDINELSESDLRKAVRVCLELCRLFAAAKLGHCDLRMSNILWGPQPFVADFEAAHKLPWKVPHNFQPFTDWDAGTLSRSREYTTKSDVYQVGIMMDKYDGLTEEGRQLAALLKRKKVEAEVALKDPYLS